MLLPYNYSYKDKDGLSHSNDPVDDGTIVSDEADGSMEDETLPGIPVIRPRRRYAGARNYATTKDGKHSFAS